MNFAIELGKEALMYVIIKKNNYHQRQGLLRCNIRSRQTIESPKHLKHLFKSIARGLHLHRS
jgi:hypothetical protein